MADTFTVDELYDANCYRFHAPPVCHAAWDRAAWIAYIGTSGWFCYAVRSVEPGAEPEPGRWIDRVEAERCARELMLEREHPYEVITLPTVPRDAGARSS